MLYEIQELVRSTAWGRRIDAFCTTILDYSRNHKGIVVFCARFGKVISLPHTSRVENVKSCPNRPKGPILTVVKAKIDVNIFNSEMDNNVIVSNITTYEKFTIENQKKLKQPASRIIPSCSYFHNAPPERRVTRESPKFSEYLMNIKKKPGSTTIRVS
ncbi:hypothetical protein [Paenibacillus phytohabitans]|uniref:hypothetical protein n=1 Tax=Paenibacillus phytohabitans TaxID=2654978 RepID=UPI001492DD1E|nr:hypothetical protein [Paenibacillus phytohabitans]